MLLCFGGIKAFIAHEALRNLGNPTIRHVDRSRNVKGVITVLIVQSIQVRSSIIIIGFQFAHGWLQLTRALREHRGSGTFQLRHVEVTVIRELRKAFIIIIVWYLRGTYRYGLEHILWVVWGSHVWLFIVLSCIFAFFR